MLERLIVELWAVFGSILNTNFGAAVISAFIGTAGGAWGGAWAAQKIAERTKRKEFLAQQVRDSNNAIESAYTVCNAALGLKTQHVKRMKEKYDAQREVVLKYEDALREGKVSVQFVAELGQIEFLLLEGLRVRLDRLEGLLDKLSVSGRPRPLMDTLTSTVERLNESIRLRNRLIGEISSLGDEGKKLFAMFGVKEPGGVTNQFFKSSMEQMAQGTDDCIAFGDLLMQDLKRHGERAQDQYILEFGKRNAPKAHKPKWDEETLRAFPPRELYQAWIDNFVGDVPPTKGRRIGKVWYRIRKSWRISVRSVWNFLVAWGPSVWVLVKYSVMTAIVSAVLLIAYRQVMMKVIEPLWQWVFG